MSDSKKTTVGFEIEEATYKKLKAIAILRDKKMKELFNEMVDSYIKQFDKDGLIDKFMKQPVQERLHRVIGQQVEEFVDKRGTTIVKKAKPRKKSVSKKK